MYRLFKVPYFFLTNIFPFNCRAAMVCPAGKGLWDSWFSVPLAGPAILPADVLWGLFVTHSFLPNGHSFLPTNKPHRTSAGRLVVVLDTLCLSSIRLACPKYVELAFRCACSYSELNFDPDTVLYCKHQWAHKESLLTIRWPCMTCIPAEKRALPMRTPFLSKISAIFILSL